MKFGIALLTATLLVAMMKITASGVPLHENSIKPPMEKMQETEHSADLA